MALSKRIRFEVFKRDSFTCQYCGQKAPDVVLHVDHIHPKSGGGSDDLLNLVTSCVACNLGKGPRTLEDNTVVAKQRQQLDDLQERREQLEMMVDWQKSLLALDRTELDEAADFWSEVTEGQWHLTEHGRSDLQKLVKRFGLAGVLEAMRVAAGAYFEREEGKLQQPSVDQGFSKIGGICFNKQRYAADPGAEDRDREMWIFIREYRSECSHYPDNNQLRRFWRERVEPSLRGIPDVSRVGVAVVDACLSTYFDGRYISYWDALQVATFPWEDAD